MLQEERTNELYRRAIHVIDLLNDLIYSSEKYEGVTHTWFFSLLPTRSREIISTCIEREDLTQELTLYTLTLAKGYTGSVSKFESIAKKYLPLYLRDIGEKLAHEKDAEEAYVSMYPTSYEMQYNKPLSLRWVLIDPDNELPIYDRYLLYLYYTRNYNFKELENVLYYSDRTLKKQVKELKLECLESLLIN